jgi:hypothetical protein
MAPPPYARVMEDMVKGREYATQLQALLRESPEAGCLVDRILHGLRHPQARAVAGGRCRLLRPALEPGDWKVAQRGIPGLGWRRGALKTLRGRRRCAFQG